MMWMGVWGMGAALAEKRLQSNVWTASTTIDEGSKLTPRAPGGLQPPLLSLTFRSY